MIAPLGRRIGAQGARLYGRIKFKFEVALMFTLLNGEQHVSIVTFLDYYVAAYRSVAKIRSANRMFRSSAFRALKV